MTKDEAKWQWVKVPYWTPKPFPDPDLFFYIQFWNLPLALGFFCFCFVFISKDMVESYLVVKNDSMMACVNNEKWNLKSKIWEKGRISFKSKPHSHKSSPRHTGP